MNRVRVSVHIWDESHTLGMITCKHEALVFSSSLATLFMTLDTPLKPPAGGLCMQPPRTLAREAGKTSTLVSRELTELASPLTLG